MSVDVLAMHCAALPAARAVGFKGTEALCRPFEFDVLFTVPAGTDVRAAINARATLTLQRGADAPPMCWHGVFVRLRLLRESADRALYHGSLVPRLWLQRHSVRSFVHTKSKIDTFLTKTLTHGGLTTSDFRFSVDTDRYPEEEFVCQYRESHLDFTHRWLEREGLYYHFEHPVDDGGAEVMVIVDSKDQHEPLSGNGRVRYHPTSSHDVSAGECFREVHVDLSALPAAVRINDYNYANPAASVSGEHAVSKSGHGEVREYGYRVFTQDEATRLAQVKAESMACRELTLHATGNATGLRAGYVFELEDGPSDMPTRYLAVEVRHAAAITGGSFDITRFTGMAVDETYRVEVVAIPADVQFRAAQATPWPRIYGFENGVVDGPGDSQYAQIDDMGRYLLRLKFDASDLPDGATSTYLRMMQPHGGTVEGWHFPLRKGTEVMVSFQGGDPDRPFIAGVVPNAHRPSTVTSRNLTQNVLRTGGSNHMVVEDLEGKQHIDLFTPVGATNVHMGGPTHQAFVVPPKTPDANPDMQPVDCMFYVSTEGNAGFNVCGEWWQNVGGKYYVDVSDDATIHYAGVHTINVDGDSNEFYNSHQNIKVRSGRTDKVESGGMTQDIHGGFTQTIEAGGKQDVLGSWLQKISGQNHDDYGSWKTDVKLGWTADIKGAWSHTVKGDIRIESTSGTIHVESPTKITLKAQEVTLDAPSKVHKHTNLYIETFGSKNSFGIQKADFTGVNFARNNLKVEFTAYAAAKGGYKGEIWINNQLKFATLFETLGANMRKSGTEAWNSAARMLNAAITKLG
ncbi:rhs family protein [Sorangium cellulosum So ce56]|uniref:Rhs family protein n=1 Tax=Sorangium cellulosum (strain So ce56) TaxID=448385 RepID=A9FUM5_SORC5|nr:type VI secretion system tip protein TssI/VgrG [Sorangium cellulosum]CAN98647.1 rhs family protein [Sorangium cellulosum So ce56]